MLPGRESLPPNHTFLGVGMSTEIATQQCVSLTRYAGPVAEDEMTRARIQITNNRTGEFVTLSHSQWETLRFMINRIDVWDGITIRPKP